MREHSGILERNPLLLRLIVSTFAQLATDVKLESVSFGGGHELCSDVTLAKYTAPQWKDMDGNGAPDLGSSGDRNDSLAYTKGTTPSIGATFKVSALQPNSIFKVKALVSPGMEVPPITLEMENGKATLPLTTLNYLSGAPGKWYDSIRIYRKSDGSAIRVYWSYQINGGGWTRFATSMHQVYLTAAAPTVANNQETLFYYACNKPDGLSGDDGKAVANQIFKDFETLEMQRVDRFSGIPTGGFMTFWRGGPTDNVVQDGKGVCGGWAEFFNDTLKVHGYPASNIGITAKNILFSDDEPRPEPRPGASWIPKGNPKILSGNAPRSGQGHSSAAQASWSSHAISLAFEEYYDPSYGIGPASSKSLYEDMAIDWYGYESKKRDKIIPIFEPRVKETKEKLTYK